VKHLETLDCDGSDRKMANTSPLASSAVALITAVKKVYGIGPEAGSIKVITIAINFV
jgi:hypothetical protein